MQSNGLPEYDLQDVWVADAAWMQSEECDDDTRITADVAEAAAEIEWVDQAALERYKGRPFNPKAVRVPRGFSYRALRRLGRDLEAVGPNALSSLERVGVQNQMNAWYIRRGVSYPEYTVDMSITSRQVHLSPQSAGLKMPRITDGQVRFDTNQSIALEDIEIVPIQIMGGLELDNRLIDDDQTGQMSNQLRLLAEAVRNYEENYAAIRMMGGSGTIGPDTIAADGWTTKNFQGTTISAPYSVNMYETGNGNRLATFRQLDWIGYQRLFTQMSEAIDANGLKMGITPNRLVVSAADRVPAKRLLKSQFHPGVQGYGGETYADASAGGLNSQLVPNGMDEWVNAMSVNFYLTRGAWNLVEDGRGLLFVNRSPMEIMMELPNAGDSFNKRVTRIRSHRRFECAGGDYRFMGQGNDGSVTYKF